MRVCTCVCRACGREQAHAYTLRCVHKIYRLETQSRLDGYLVVEMVHGTALSK